MVILIKDLFGTHPDSKIKRLKFIQIRNVTYEFCEAHFVLLNVKHKIL